MFNRAFLLILAAILVAGLGMQLWLWQRQGILADQNAVLYAGVDFNRSDALPAFAKPCSAGAQLPGFLLPALVGGAIQVWHNYKSPALLAMVLQVFAFVLLAWVMVKAAHPLWALAYLSLYWLSAWRLFHAASVWEPAFVFLPAALHMALCFKLRDAKSLVASAALALVVGLGFQIHASAMILLLATVILWYSKQLKLNWIGFALGSLLAVLCYIPTINAQLGSAQSSALPQTHQGLLLSLLSFAKGATFWIRLSTPDLGERLAQASGFHEGAPKGLLMALRLIAMAFIVPSALATWKLLRASNHELWPPGQNWLRAYALAMAGAVLAASLASPASVQTWHVVIALHAALIPMVWWLFASRWPMRLRRLAVGGWLILNLTAVILLGLYHEQYQPPTPESLELLNAPAEVRSLVP